MRNTSAPIHVWSILCGLICLILLLFIGHWMYHEPLFIWDEAIYANNALEMARDGQWLVYTCDGIADHYNTKPPLVLWLQAISFKLFGYYDWVFRLPSFLALLGTLFLFFRFARWLNYSLLIPFTASFILLTSPGAIRPHVFMTGDLDAVLTFFTTALSLLIIRMVSSPTISSRAIWLAFIFLIGAYYTKSTASLLLLPSFIILLVKENKFCSLLKMKSFYLGMFVFVSTVVLYYIIRARYDDGYLTTVWQSEFLRFTSNIMDWHQQPFSFYLVNILKRFNTYYTMGTLILLIPFFILKDLPYRREVFNLLLIQVIFLLVISIPSVKLEWYDAPVYPIWAMMLSMMIIALSKRLFPSNQFYFVIFLCLLFITPIFLILKRQLLAERVLLPQEKEAAVLKRTSFDEKKKYKVLMDVEDNKLHHFDALKFYQKSIRLNDGLQIELARYLYQVQEHDQILVLQQIKLDSLHSLFNVEQNSLQEDHFLQVKQKK